MPNTAFRVSFWVLCIAFGLTIVAALSRPEEIRLALAEQRRQPQADPSAPQLAAVPDSAPDVQPESLPEVDLGSSVDIRRVATAPSIPVAEEPAPVSKTPSESRPVPEPYYPSSIAEARPSESIPVRGPESTTTIDQPIPIRDATPTPAPGTPRLRIASSNPDQSLGLTSPRGARPMPTQEGPALPPPSTPVNDSNLAELTVPVPDPFESDTAPGQAAVDLEIDALRANVQRLRVAHLENILNDAWRDERKLETVRRERDLGEIRAEIHLLRTELNGALEEAHTARTSTAREAQIASTEETSKSSKPSAVRIQQGSAPDTLTFQFEEAPLSNVFRILGEHAGWTVLVEPSVSGTFSGELRDVSAEQAFAVMLKNHRCQLTRRGTFLLVNRRDAE